MWCDNCLLVFPLRGGAICLGVIMALYQFAGGVILFKYGDFYFTLLNEASIYGGYAMGQGAVALLAVIAFSTRSYIFSRFIFLIYPIIIVLGAIRAGVMIWSLNHYSYKVLWTCSHGGIKWIDQFDKEEYRIAPVLLETSPRLPPAFCKVGVDQISATFIFFLAVDFVLMCYFYFLTWRFTVRLVHYPVQKNDLVYP